MATAASGSSAYCTAAQFIQRYDERAVRQLLSDTGAAAGGSLSSNTVLAALLKEASGLVEAAACAGQRYVITDTQNDLSDLTGNSAELLAGLVAHITMYLLWSRRPNIKPGDRPPPTWVMATDFLEQLRLGERVFGILENHQAAALDSVVETRGDVETRNGVTIIADRFFGTRSNRLRP